MPADLGELARHRAEDTVPFRRHFLALLLDEHDRILIETDVGAVFASKRLGLAYNYCTEDIFLLYGLPRLGGLYGNHDDIPDAGITAMTSANHLENPSDLSAGIVRNHNDGSGLQHINYVRRQAPFLQGQSRNA